MESSGSAQRTSTRLGQKLGQILLLVSLNHTLAVFDEPNMAEPFVG